MRHLQLLPFLVAMVDATATWVNPPPPGSSTDFSDNLIWEVGSSQVLVYDTNFTAVSLCLYQNNNNSFQYITQNHATDESSTQQSYKWTVGELLDTSTGNLTFDGNFFGGEFFPNSTTPFLIFIYAEGATSGTGSSYINITSAAKEVVASTSSVSSSATKTATASATASAGSSTASASGSTTVTATTTSATTTSTATASSGVSAGAKAGIGIGVSLAVVAVLGAVALFFWRRGKQENTVQPIPYAQDPTLLHGANGAGGPSAGPFEVNGSEMADGMGGELARGTYRYHLARSDVTSPGFTDNSTSAGSGSQELDSHSQQGRL